MLAAAVKRAAAARGTATAIVDHATRRSYTELAADIDRLAGDLRALGPPSRAVLLIPQSADGLALAAACDAIGTTAIYVSALYGVERAREVLESADAEVLITVEDGAVVELARRTAAATAPGDPAEVWLLSSGTTGAAKCARHTWRGLAGASSERGERADDIWLLAYPISHFAGLQIVAQCVFSGARLVIPRDFGPAAALDALVTERVTAISCTPTYLRRLLLATPDESWPRTCVAQVTLGGETVGQPVLDAARRAWPAARILHIYASTELGAAITVRDGLEGFDAALLDGVQLKLEHGELWARRSPRSMLGYAGGPEPGDWIATGDLVEVIEGRARFRGRASEIINVGGFKVNPAVVEAVVREIEGVTEVWVVGHKSSIAGQLVKAVLCLAPGTDLAAVKREVARRCAERLPSHMTPRLFELVEDGETSLTQKRVRPA